jgi:predicted Zn-ribbon and HTH transcriptional regulator
LGPLIAQADQETSADGIKFVDSTLKALKAALEATRDTALIALNQIGQSHDEHSMRWKCKACQYIKHFTKPVALETAGRCPRCKSTTFTPIF